jgi:exopolysaccharide production protein ExoY
MSQAVGELPSAAVIENHLRTCHKQLLAKRLIDVALAIAVLVVLGPILIIITLLIRRDSPGPALFIQPRWGLQERTFLCYKFRSMHTKPMHTIGAGILRELQRDGRLMKMDDDLRVTRIGRLIRRTSIDELPQLWNVLKGDMSIVGPRPLVIHMLEPYPEIRSLRCKVRPGITGLWQINDRANNLHVSSMLRYDIEYLENFSLQLDAKILLRTVRVVISGHGAI